MLTKRNSLITIIAAFAALLISGSVASAQEHMDLLRQKPVAPEGFEYVDSVVHVRVPVVDSAYVGVDVFDFDVRQSEAIAGSMKSHMAANPQRALSGYRVRIFFDNKQTARVESENTLKKFEKMFPDILAYRTYSNPYFKVTVGDCRTKSEAMALLRRIRKEFPSAFVVKENISYPTVDKAHVYDLDTIQVLRPVVQQ
jgi:hypothetical protein